MLNSLAEVKNHGLKVVFFSSEEGPKCCTGSLQYPKDDVFAAIIFDALYPSRVVYSSTPDLWDFAGLFPLKRIEMPTPFSDHLFKKAFLIIIPIRICLILKIRNS